jgi:hypothetical protein
MSNPTWGLLAKSATDNETIEEAITRIVLAHNNDEEAHLDIGQSLQSHKASEIIDHLAESIVFDKLKRFSVNLEKFVGDEFMMMSCFESFDNWNDKQASAGSAAVGGIMWVGMMTGALANDYIQLGNQAPTGASFLDFTRNMLFQTTCKITSAITSQLAYVICGGLNFGGGTATKKNFGFKVLNGDLYAVHNDGVHGEVTTIISDVACDETHVYRAEYDAVNLTIKFYIDTVLKATHSTNLPEEFEQGMFYYYIKTTTTANRNMDMHDLLISFKRP